jgi:NADPH2:quinone reductase
MRAVVIRQFGTPDTAAIESLPDPQPAPHQVIVDIQACAVNYVDLLVFAGAYQFLPKLPFTPGKLPVGLVSAIGAKVANFSPGDRVLTMAEQGGYAEKIAVEAQNCIRLPDGLSFTDAAAMSLAYDTAWMALRDRARLAAGETVLVLGATGAVGAAAVQLARVMGARVLAGVSGPDKSARASSAGADGVIDLSRSDLRDSLRAQVYQHTEGRGADIIIDPLGGDMFDAALRALAWRGRLVVIGFAAGGIPTLKANYLLLKNIEVSGLQISDYRRRRPNLMATCFADLFAAHASGALRLESPEIFPLQDFAAALQRIELRAARGRVLLLPHTTIG